MGNEIVSRNATKKGKTVIGFQISPGIFVRSPKSNVSRWTQSAILTQDVDRALYAATRLDAGTVMINDHTAFRVDWMPFAGAKQSGYGIGGIKYTMRDMQVEKLLVLKSKGL